jgi:hypothetical protein
MAPPRKRNCMTAPIATARSRGATIKGVASTRMPKVELILAATIASYGYPAYGKDGGDTGSVDRRIIPSKLKISLSRRMNKGAILNLTQKMLAMAEVNTATREKE